VDKQIVVIGSALIRDKKTEELCERLGFLLAKNGYIVICGGRSGVMEAVCRGAKQGGGITVGILPDKGQSANPYLDIVIPTGMGNARNAILVLCSHIVIAVGGELGTLSEISLALKEGKKVMVLKTEEGISTKIARILKGHNISIYETPEEILQAITK